MYQCILNYYKGSDRVNKHITNRDKFNSLSNTELAEILANSTMSCRFCATEEKACDYDTICSNCIKEWLESEVNEMTAKQYLNQARLIDTAINCKLEELHKLKENAYSVQSVAMSERVMNSSCNNSNSVVDKIVDLEIEINAEIDKLVDLKTEIRNKIANTYNQTYISVLTHLYINCLTLEQTAEKMGKDYRTICRWHGQALQVFRKENNML